MKKNISFLILLISLLILTSCNDTAAESNSAEASRSEESVVSNASVEEPFISDEVSESHISLPFIPIE